MANVLSEDTDVLALLARSEFEAPNPSGPVWVPVNWGQDLYSWVLPIDHGVFFRTHVEYGANLVGLPNQ